MSTKNIQEGFTLIELMIVVAIIGILAAIAIPQFASYRAKAFNSSAQADLRNSMTAEESYYADKQKYFAATLAASASGGKSAAVGLSASKNVKLVLATFTATNGNKDYNGMAIHSQGNASYHVTGSVGVIR